jgi:two-component system chemotaxis response regulator CheB
MNNSVDQYDLIVVGGSSGSLITVLEILGNLKSSIDTSFVIVLHQLREKSALLRHILSSRTKIDTIEPVDKEPILKNKIYVAPPDYHLMIEENKIFSYSAEEPVNFSRPSIDVLFETAANVFKERTIGILLSGANSDGSVGLKKIKNIGGLTIVQDPKTAEYRYMPDAAINSMKVDHILSVEEIKHFLTN